VILISLEDSIGDSFKSADGRHSSAQYHESLAFIASELNTLMMAKGISLSAQSSRSFVIRPEQQAFIESTLASRSEFWLNEYHLPTGRHMRENTVTASYVVRIQLLEIANIDAVSTGW
jgi:hypothetical protein